MLKKAAASFLEEKKRLNRSRNVKLYKEGKAIKARQIDLWKFVLKNAIASGKTRELLSKFLKIVTFLDQIC